LKRSRAFAVTTDGHEALRAAKPFLKLDENELGLILRALTSLPDGSRWMSRTAFEKALGGALKAAGVKVGAPVKKAILTALSERDEAAEICRDARGAPEPDTDLRDHELVPLAQDWRADVAREVAKRGIRTPRGNRIDKKYLYRRGDMLAKRKQMMTDWAAFLGA